MKKVLMAVCLLFLVGCKGTGSPVQGAMDFRTEILQCQALEFSGEVVAYFGEQSYEFSVDCTYEIPTGDSRVEITAPEELAGIVATTSQGEPTLIYEDIVLALGDGEPSPMVAPKVLGDGWCNGYIQYADEEGTTTYQLSQWEDMTLQTYFQENKPYFCEIYKGTDCILTVTLKNFQQSAP